MSHWMYLCLRLLVGAREVVQEVGSSTMSMGVEDDTDEVDLSALERADSPMEEELGGFRFDGQDKVSKIRYHASNSHITAAIEDEEVTSEDGT